MKNERQFIYFITFFAGFSFLIYEISWNRYLSLILGTTVTASAVVLASFMTGFGFGAYIIGKHANKTKNTRKLLAGSLSLVGLISLFNFLIFEKIVEQFYGFFSNVFIADIFFFSLTFIFLLIPAFFMGGVIPLANKIAISENKDIAKKLGTVYASETLGSTLGAVTAGIILLGTIGQKQTIFAAVFINLLLAGYLFFFKKIPDKKNTVSDKKSNKKLNPANSVNSSKIALISTFIIGFAVLSMQIFWIRIFKTYFTNTSYTFTIITAFVILGLAIGSWLYKRQGNIIKNNDFTMLKVLIIIILLSVAGLLILYKLPELLLFPFKEIMSNPFVRLIIVPVTASILIVMPPAIASGFAFPLACRMNSDGAKDISKKVGIVLMFNTIGSAIGPVVAIFVLIPILGAGKSILSVVLLLSGLSLYVAYLLKADNKINIYKNVLIAKTLIILLIFIFINKIQFVPPSVKMFDKTILSYKETAESTIVVVNEKRKGVFGNSTFVNNSSVIGSNYDAIKAVKMVGHFPFFSGLECKNALIIGFGIGVTTSAIASHDDVQSIDCVELAPGLTETAKYYKDFNQEIYNSKKINITAGDGRHFLQMTKKKYDLISCDPTHPVLGSGNLYTKEYFQQCRKHLNPQGMISQYLPLHKLRLNDLLGIIKTFHSVFPNSTVWLGQYHAVLLGKMNNNKNDFTTWENKVNEMPKDNFLYLEPYHFASCIIFDGNKIENFPKDIKINTDNLSYTEFFSFDCFDADNLYKNLKYLSENRCKVNDVFSGIKNQDRMNNFVEGNIKLTESLYYSLKGESQKALDKLRKACTVNPEDKEYPFLIKLYYRIEK